MKRTLLVTVFVGATLLSMQVTQAQVPIYREVFGNNAAPAGTNAPLSTVGWAGYWGATANDQSNPSLNNFGVSAAAGRPSTLDNINAGTSLSTVNGLVFTSGGAGSAAVNNWIAYTTGYTVDTTATPIADISFYAGNAAGAPGYRIAVEIGGNWYASSATLANAVAVGTIGGFAAGAQMVTFNWTTAASAWDSLSFTPGSALVLGSTLISDLPGGNVTGFGLYSDTPASGGPTRRFDTFQIDTVPEPSSVLLVLSGVGVLISLRRSRKA
jgi:hypothetical protein